jgi:hypothetical protein
MMRKARRDAPDSYGQVSKTGYCRNCGEGLVELFDSKYVTCPNGDIGLLPRGEYGNEIAKLQSTDPIAIRQETPRGEVVTYLIPGHDGLWVVDESHTGGVMAWYRPHTVWRHWSFRRIARLPKWEDSKPQPTPTTTHAVGEETGEKKGKS